MLCGHGILAGLPNQSLVLAVPCDPGTYDISNPMSEFAVQIHSQLCRMKVTVNDAELQATCRTRFTHVKTDHSLADAIQSLLADENAETAIRYFDSTTWHDISSDNVPSSDSESVENQDEDDTAIVSPAEAAALVAGNKKKPAAVCIKEDTPEASSTAEPAAVSVTADSTAKTAEASAKVPTNAPKAAQAASANASKESTPAAESTETVAKKPAASEPHDAVSANEIDELFAIARKRKENPSPTQPTVDTAAELNSMEAQTAEDLQAIQETVHSAKPDIAVAEANDDDSKEAVTADDIAKLFAAAKAKG